jgi:ornithine cyclodeaminase/alanine dehydrogenase-like protein (mu-crystallin family)
VAELLGIEECIAAVERAFRLYGEGKTQAPGILGVHAAGGGFHIKAGIMNLERPYFVAKTNANFPNNREIGLPTIQGVVVVCDAADGRLLALMDSIEITIIRTGAATAVAAKYLAREDAKTALICGCGSQGRISLEAIMKVRRLEKIFAYDIDRARARRFAGELSGEFEIEITEVGDPAAAARESDICVTCTTARKYFLLSEHISPGTFVAAVGADSEEKQELEPALLAAGKIVTDVLQQCATIGELHHALKDGCVSRADVYGELGEIVAGKKSGRANEDEIIVFDSTGMALQDVAAAAIVYERALESGLETRINFND